MLFELLVDMEVVDGAVVVIAVKVSSAVDAAVVVAIAVVADPCLDSEPSFLSVTPCGASSLGHIVKV